MRKLITIQNFIVRRKYQNSNLTNFTHFTMIDKKNEGSSLQDLKVELLNKVLNAGESAVIRGGKTSELNNFNFNGCGGMMPQ